MNRADSDSRDSGVLSNPLSFLRSGSFGWYGAGLDGRGGYGYCWSLRSANTTYSSYLDFYNTNLSPQLNYSRGYGFAVRCVDSFPKSFTTLINTSYSMKNTSGEDSRDSGVLSNPLSFPRSGYFPWGYAGPGSRGGSGYYWSLRSASTTSSNVLNFDNTSLYPQNDGNRGNGFAVRRNSFTPNPSPLSLILAIL